MSQEPLEKQIISQTISVPNDADGSIGVRVDETPAERRFRWVFTAGLWILGVVGLVIFASTGLYAVQYMDIVGQKPVIPSNASNEQVKQILENYKTLNDIRLNAAQSFFDNTVVKVFLPIFTTVLGVVLGIRIGESDQKD